MFEATLVVIGVFISDVAAGRCSTRASAWVEGASK